MDAHDFKVKGGIFGLGDGHVLSRDEEWGDGKKMEGITHCVILENFLFF